jgi:metal-responsive CopG/Arc/MetJ family transcriptional regulator
MTNKSLIAVTVVFDRELLKRISQAAKKAKLNRSAFIRAAAEAKLNA